MCSLHLTHPSAHTQRGAVGGSLPCSRVSLQSWTMPELRFEPTTSDYQSNALSTRPRLPLNSTPFETTWWRSKNRHYMTITWNLFLFICWSQSRWGKLGCRVFFQSGAITSTVYGAWDGALWLVERMYRILQRREKLAFIAVWKKKGQNMTE